jgi:CD48 antigen
MISPVCAPGGPIGSYTLSVRDLDQDEGDVVKHYRIRNMDDGGFYITAKISFSTIRELVKHHKRTRGRRGPH